MPLLKIKRISALDMPNCEGSVKISTDGACEPNPGRGGWAYVLNRDGVETEAAGTVPRTTNNQMELRAAIEALSVLPEPSEVETTTRKE